MSNPVISVWTVDNKQYNIENHLEKILTSTEYPSVHGFRGESQRGIKAILEGTKSCMNGVFTYLQWYEGHRCQ